MTLPQRVYATARQQEELVVALEDRRITDLAKRIAYYAAMIDAAEADPLDNPKEQQEILRHFRNVMNENVQTYQILVNEAL